MIIMEELLIINWTREAPLPAGENSLPPPPLHIFPTAPRIQLDLKILINKVPLSHCIKYQENIALFTVFYMTTRTYCNCFRGFYSFPVTLSFDTLTVL
jgi:hypothetical protein